MEAKREAELKEAANRLSDNFMDSFDTYATAAEAICFGGKYTEAEYTTIIRLCDVYIAVKDGDMSRAEAVKKQRELLRECDFLL